jgi:hypothetical protein
MKTQLFKLKFGILFLMAISAYSNGYAQSLAPQIECKIKNCINPISQGTPSSVCTVANGKYIELWVHLKKPENTSIEEPGPKMINPNPVPSPGVYYLLKVVRESDGAEVPVQIFERGGGKGNSDFVKEISFQIPDSDDVRQSKIQAWWNKIKANANTADQTKIAQATVTNNDIIKAMNQRLVDNQLGRFKVTCSYVSTVPGAWTGQVDSILTLNVANMGTLLDKAQ